MHDRFRIDWGSLTTLTRRRTAERNVEDHALRKHNREKAHHVGRNHIKNWERRRAREDAIERQRAMSDAKAGKHRSYVDAVRAYWRGDRETHP